MATIKLTSTAKKRATTRTKKAIIVAMACIAGTNYAQEQAAMKAAMRDMKADLGKGNVYSVNYDCDPFDGMWA